MRVDICWWLSQWFVVLVLLGVYDALVDGCGVWEHLRSFSQVKWGSEVSPRFYLLVLCLVYIKRIRRQGESKIPCVTPETESLSSDLLQTIVSYWRESHIEPCQTSPMEIFCKNSHQPRDVDYFGKKVPPQMYKLILNALPIEKELQIWGVAKLQVQGSGWETELGMSDYYVITI